MDILMWTPIALAVLPTAVTGVTYIARNLPFEQIEANPKPFAIGVGVAAAAGTAVGSALSAPGHLNAWVEHASNLFGAP